MELYAKGQLSFLILTCLQERDFYGLDIISEISNRSNGRINLKKPSVYSNLTRMEKQGYISAYLQSSDFGPNRKYYSLTENGRNFYKELKDYFDRNNIDVFRDFADADTISSNQTVEHSLEEISPETENENKQTETSVEKIDDDFFDFSSISSDETKTEENEDILEESKVNVQVFNNEINENMQESNSNDFKYINNEIPEQESPTDSVKEDTSKEFSIKTALLNAEVSNEESKSIDEYNKRLYDISKDINKYKRKRSFAEDQISMTATAPLSDSQEKTKANIEEFKNSFLESKNRNQSERLTNLDFSRYTTPARTVIEKSDKPEEVKNDAVFITRRVNVSDIERPKKIEPPKFKINPVESSKESKLPAPKRDLAIDPSHKEILSKLYSKTKDSSEEEVREDALYDFEDLKKFYSNQNISFNEYKKPQEKIVHNTNKLYFMVGLITLLLSSGLSAILYVVLSLTSFTFVYTNFLYILLPALWIVDFIIKSYNLAKFKGGYPAQMLPQWQIWLAFILSAGFVIGLNFVCGLSIVNFNLYATTIILPILMLFVALPARYYLKRTLLIKYWR